MLDNVQITWRGIMHDATGYSHASREHVMSLHRLGINLRVEKVSLGSPAADIRPDHQQVIDQLAKVPLDDTKTKVLIYHLQPFSCDPFLEKHKFDYVLSTTAWEADRFPRNWWPNLDLLDGLILPSSQNHKAAQISGVKVPVYVVRYGADTTHFTPTQDRSLLLDVKDTFNFLSVFQWQHRKAPELLIEAFTREFGEKEQVSLVVKTHFGGPAKRSQQLSILDQIAKLKARIEASQGCKAAPIFITSDVFNDSDMMKLYALSDCFVLPTRGEGVGMPFMESMAAGRPIIATGWGGQTDFLTESNSYLVDYDLRSCTQKQDDNLAPLFSTVFSDDMQWAECRIDSLRQSMRHAFANPTNLREKGAKARADALDLTWDKSGRALVAAIEQACSLPKRLLGEGRATSVVLNHLL